MSLQLNGVALVTGAGSGIGRECALGYAAEGARGVVLADLDYETALDAAQESETVAINPAFTALAMRVDVTDQASVAEMVNTTMRIFGRIDYCVNSAGAGIQKPTPIETADPAEMNRFWQVAVMGTLHCIQAVTQVMKNQSIETYRARGRVRETGRGTIINVASCNSFVATPHMAQDTITKHAVLGLTRNAALDTASHGIRVNAVCPGWVDSQVDPAVKANGDVVQTMKSIIPMSRTGRPEEIADVVLLLSSPRTSYVTGAGWLVDGGMTLQVQT